MQDPVGSPECGWSVMGYLRGGKFKKRVSFLCGA